jgi:hypothetical protein
MSGLVKNFKQPDNRLNAALAHPFVKLLNIDAERLTTANIAAVPHHYGWFNSDLLHKEANPTTPKSTEFSVEQKKGGV